MRRAWNSIFDLTPTLTTEEQFEVGQAIRNGVRRQQDFYTMIVLSAIIAALGLLLNSPAVIIGAMIIAPLMSAIEGVSLGIVEGDTPLLKEGARTATGGALVAVTIGLIIGWLIPGSEPTAEIMGRAQPNLLDLGVALAAGGAAAYALCRKEVAAALAGVAIAVALVPPLATIGIGLSMLRFDIAGGATLLFATNLAAIVAASALVYLLLGFNPPETQKRQRRVLRRSLWGATGLLLTVTLILAALTWQVVRETQFARTVETAIQAELAAWPGAELVSLEQSHDRQGIIHLDLTLAYSGELTSYDVFGVQNGLAERFQRPVAVSVMMIPTIRLAPLAPPGLEEELVP
jgi:uncharacterized hydrophobic protein (TIGR00271 family)